MRHVKWLLSLLLLGATSAAGANYRVGIGVDCDFAGVCFWRTPLTINVGDTVTFFIYGDVGDTGQPHNVVADDGSFRCARGCDGSGGDGTPAGYQSQWSFTRTFNMPGIVNYHDEVSGAAGVIVVHGAPGFGIGPGMTGMWFNPQQSGHGFTIEVLAGTPLQLLVSWSTFSPAGGQSWILGLGAANGTQATLQGYQGLGGRFPPNFDAANVHVDPWGTLIFTFFDCNHAHVDWASTTPGYGSGSMDLERLTKPAGLTCP